MIRLCMLSFLIVVGSVKAQESEAPPVGLIEVKVVTQFRVRPSQNARSFGPVAPGTRLLWVEGQQDANYLRAIGSRGPSGWVAASDVQVLRPSPSVLREKVKKPCVPNLGSCPTTGCAPDGSPEALANQTKRRSPSSGDGATLLTYAELAALQRQGEKLVGQRTVPKDRSVLNNLKLGTGRVSEGAFVRITGFIAANDPGPHPNTRESVNCDLTAAGNNDFHINVTNSPNQTEFAGVVVEMIPQSRPQGWSIEKLQALRSSQRRVLIAGALFYDSIHIVNDDAGHDIHGQPKRFSLWEIHPITGFFVCKRADNVCNPDTKTDWTPFTSLNAN